MSVLVVFCTFPDSGVARRIVHTLVEERLVACGNLLPGVESIYRWKGAVETSAEVMVILKTTEMAYAQLQARIKELHPYDLPEVLALKAYDGLPDYLQWVLQSCK